MVNENNSARICALRSRTIRPVREGAYWEKEEIERLEEMFNSGAGITEIALVLERSEPAVVQQIEKLDLYGRKQNPQRKRQNKEVEVYVCPYSPESCPKLQKCREEGMECSESTKNC